MVDGSVECIALASVGSCMYQEQNFHKNDFLNGDVLPAAKIY